ncbi:hypothetical protein A4X13_0g7917 [Tilletia indica]|uniref:Uncharacterized protein n=1 Tax=Tilletia indica TaxID=43049 RepID=A0A177TTM8_9BASI|nr:hypothetical protein A4X13_0g7917 [Tilletia indica]
MGDIYDVFSLPPPPPPTFLSHYTGADRARLPNFLASDDPIAAAKQYLHAQIMFECMPSLWIHVKVVTGLAGIIVVAAMAVIVRRLWQRSLWVIRLKQTERGPLIVPNAIMIFAGTEGLFVILFLAFINCVYVAWQVKREPLANLILWITLTWSPLIAGPIWSTFGVWHARPPSGTPKNTRSVKHSTLFGKKIRFPKPLLISLWWMMIPFIQMLSVLGPGVRGNNYRSEAVRMYYQWYETYGNATELNRPMLVALQNIWEEDLRAFYWLAISMFIWFGWTVILFAVYSSVTLRLLLPLRAQLLALQERNASVSGSDTQRGTRSGFFDATTKAQQVESVQLPLETPRLRSLAANYVGGRLEAVDFQDASDEKDAVNEHWGLRANDLKEDAPNTSFFPPIKPSAVVRPATDSETSERYLRAAYRHFLFQGVTVSLAIVYFSEVTIYIALTVYSYNERRILGKSMDTAFLQAMWGCIVFGSCVMISITLRTYEPMLVSLLNNNNLGGTNRSPTASKSVRLNKLAASQEQKQSFSSSNGGTTVVNSPTPTPMLPSMDPVKENDSDDEGRQWRAEPESWALIGSRGAKRMKGRHSPMVPSTPENYPPPRSSSAQGQVLLRKADILASTRTPEYEAPAYIPRPMESTTTTPQTTTFADNAQQPFYTSNKGGLNFLDSTSSLNDRSLREMPSMGPDTMRRLASYTAMGFLSSDSRTELSSPRHGSLDRHNMTTPTSISSSASGAAAGNSGLGLGPALVPAGTDFVSSLRGTTPLQPEDERAKAYRTAFMREMLSDNDATVLSPPPRSARRPSRTSTSS